MKQVTWHPELYWGQRGMCMGGCCSFICCESSSVELIGKRDRDQALGQINTEVHWNLSYLHTTRRRVLAKQATENTRQFIHAYCYRVDAPGWNTYSSSDSIFTQYIKLAVTHTAVTVFVWRYVGKLLLSPQENGISWAEGTETFTVMVTMITTWLEGMTVVMVKNEQRSPVIEADVLLTHPSTSTSSLYRHCGSMITTPDFLLPDRHISGSISERKWISVFHKNFKLLL